MPRHSRTPQAANISIKNVHCLDRVLVVGMDDPLEHTQAGRQRRHGPAVG